MQQLRGFISITLTLICNIELPSHHLVELRLPGVYYCKKVTTGSKITVRGCDKRNQYVDVLK